MDMYTDLTGKSILIFGAANRGGIGFAAAQALAACGCRLHLADKDDAVLDAARETAQRAMWPTAPSLPTLPAWRND